MGLIDTFPLKQWHFIEGKRVNGTSVWIRHCSEEKKAVFLSQCQKYISIAARCLMFESFPEHQNIFALCYDITVLKLLKELNSW